MRYADLRHTITKRCQGLLGAKRCDSLPLMHMENHTQGRSNLKKSGSLKAAIIRYVMSILAFLGLYASCQVCPFCGRPGCIGGGAFSAFLGFITATIAHISVHWERIKVYLKRRLGLQKDGPEANNKVEKKETQD